VGSSSSFELHLSFHAEKKPYECHECEVKSTTVEESEKYEIIFP